ncbi:MAG: PIG-L family deacetylase [Actinomycetota bacterium]|nr:PIG-L family deacetylase [Actinomycetota bacterium]
MARSRRPPVAEGPAVGTLPSARSVLAVCAHPDDESFGLGAALATLAAGGATVAVLSFTRGEASTLRAAAGDLASVRATELSDAGRALGASRVRLLDHPDGQLASVPLEEMVHEALALGRLVGADLVMAFDTNGVTGHPDHRRATEAALGAARDLHSPLLAWGLVSEVADRLNSELGTTFVGRPARDYDVVARVDRSAQHAAIACHRSQSSGNTVLTRRLELQGDLEHFVWLA